jgi:hypothetical protein
MISRKLTRVNSRLERLEENDCAKSSVNVGLSPLAGSA